MPLVLKGLDLVIPAKSKVGVVGRTGAGKSTLMVALMRIVELAEGTILIDDVDIKKLGLTRLRSKIASGKSTTAEAVRDRVNDFFEDENSAAAYCPWMVFILVGK